MADVTNYKGFRDKLASLPLSQQREVGARFIANVLDLSDDPRLKEVIQVTSNPDASAEELQKAYRMAYSVYVETHPHSDLSELNFNMQAAHFVAEACLTCAAPVYQEAKVHHLAQKVAMYCLMARTCASIPHEAESPDFSTAETATQKITHDQYEILNGFSG